jgi:hypothetical protein
MVPTVNSTHSTQPETPAISDQAYRVPQVPVKVNSVTHGAVCERRGRRIRDHDLW